MNFLSIHNTNPSSCVQAVPQILWRSMYYVLFFDNRNTPEKVPKLSDQISFLILPPKRTNIVAIRLIVVVLVTRVARVEVLVPCVSSGVLRTRPEVVVGKRQGHALTRHHIEYSVWRLAFALSLVAQRS